MNLASEGRTLGQACAERGWRFVELDGQSFIYDERTQYLARVDDRVIAGLRTSVADGPLRTVLETLTRQPNQPAATTTGSEPSGRDSDDVVSLRLLGVRVDVHCAYQPCAEAIRSFHSFSSTPAGASSPEVVVWCDLEGPSRYLFRSRPDDLTGTPLAGVSVQTLRSDKQGWTSTLPPIPPLGAWPFKDRFAAVHAAAIRMPEGMGVLLAGERGSGKSTAALILSQRPGVEVLCDETALVYCRTRLVEPFPHAVGVWRDGNKVQVPITDLGIRVAREPVAMERLVFLRCEPAGDAQLRKLSRAEAFRMLLPHHRDAGASAGDAMQTLLGLAEQTDAWLLQHSNPDELAELLGEVLSG